MKTIIAGSRHLKQLIYVKTAVFYSKFTITEVISGGCEGIDQAGEKWAGLNGVPVRRFLPAWDEHGKAAGPIRNWEMATYADALIAVWNGQSKGTKDMIDRAIACGLNVFVMTFYPYGGTEPDWPKRIKSYPKFRAVGQLVGVCR